MNRAGLIVVVAALLLAVASVWLPSVARAQGQDKAGTMTIAALLDASLTSAPVLSHAANGQQPLDRMLAGREVQVIEVDKVLDGNQADMLSDLLSASEVLQRNVVLVRGAAKTDPALGALLAAHDVPLDRVVAVDLTDDTARLVTVYGFND
jgi:hypothetical protein